MNAEIEISDEIVQKEFDRSTDKFQVITSWVGIALNLFWFISDYYIIPEQLLPFFILRVTVSSVAILALWLKSKSILNIYQCMFILVLGISLQNAYMWNVMDLEHFQKHAFAYMVLFIGVGMLVLWKLVYSLLVAIITIVVNLILFYLYSPLSFEEFLINGTLITFTVGIFSIFIIRNRYRLIFNDIKRRLQLEKSNLIIEQKHKEVLQQKIEIQSQKETLEDKNREITDSIRYAKNIQSAFIPSEEKFNSFFDESFVLFKPKDIVSGDFYWIHQLNQKIFYVTADCTGHGVPGGFMTMLGLSFLDEIIAGQKTESPAEVLNLLREKIITTLNQSGKIGESKDGMDISICCIDRKNHTLTYSAANNNLYIVRSKDSNSQLPELIELKADRQACGYNEQILPFVEHTIELQNSDCIYSFTDGFADQFGGPKGKKFRYKQFEELLIQNSGLAFADQKSALLQAHESWKTELDQVDDILVIGIRYLIN